MNRGFNRWLFAGLCALCALCGGCYSFRGGSAPAHLKTIAIAPVEDNSGFGRGTVRQDVGLDLVRKFRDDNSLRVVDASGTTDSRLDLTITALRTNQRIGVSNAEFETEREVTIEAQVTFTDNIKRKAIFKDKSFVGRSQYRVDQSLAGESQAITKAIDKLTNEVLLECVAAW